MKGSSLPKDSSCRFSNLGHYLLPFDQSINHYGILDRKVWGAEAKWTINPKANLMWSQVLRQNDTWFRTKGNIRNGDIPHLSSADLPPIIPGDVANRTGEESGGRVSLYIKCHKQNPVSRPTSKYYLTTNSVHPCFFLTRKLCLILWPPCSCLWSQPEG